MRIRKLARDSSDISFDPPGASGASGDQESPVKKNATTNERVSESPAPIEEFDLSDVLKGHV